MYGVTDRIIQDWYEQYGQGLYRHLCSKVRNPDEAQDISQETFLKVAQRLSSKERDDVIRNPKAFLYRVAFNEFYNRHRRKKLQNHLQEIFGETDAETIDTITPEQLALDREEYALVAEAIDELPAKQREVFLMTRVEHMSHREVASTLGVKIDTVKKHVGRVLATLRGTRSEYLEGKPNARTDEKDG